MIVFRVISFFIILNIFREQKDSCMTLGNMHDFSDWWGRLYWQCLDQIFK